MPQIGNFYLIRFNKLIHVENLIFRYLLLVQEVLMSVCKTEESLRRLKSRNVNASDDTSSQLDTMSDEMKIRLQIKLDVGYFFDKVNFVII